MTTNFVLEVDSLYKRFPLPRGIVGSLTRRPQKNVHAIDGISFKMKPGEILGLVGESGSGKTTTAMSVLGLAEPSAGTIHFNGSEVMALTRGRERLGFRRQMQLAFQDPYEALNPRQTVYDIVAEPLIIHGLTSSKAEQEQRVADALDAAGLKPPETYFGRYPQELSGGQRQRVGIAGALVLQPSFLVADEPVSMLDVSIQADILNLLRQLRDDHGISILYITHDLATAAYFTDRIAVMYLGKIVEIGPTAQVLREPQHPYTQALISVIPVPNPRRRKQRVILQGETPNPIDVPSGCRFHPRCPVAVTSCSQAEPTFTQINLEHQAACLLLAQQA